MREVIAMLIRSRALLVLAILIWVLPVRVGSGQTAKPNTPLVADMRERVATIIRDTLKRGEGEITNDGVKLKTWTNMPPTEEAIEEIRSFGDDVVQILSEYLTSEDGREKQLAIRFLGLVGGSRIVEPLRMVIKNDKQPGMRAMALTWLAEAPWELASPIIREAAESDGDPGVRKVANDLLQEGPRR